MVITIVVENILKSIIIDNNLLICQFAMRTRTNFIMDYNFADNL